MSNSRIADLPNCRIAAAGDDVATRHAVSLLRRVLALLMATLREIFEEAAYARFLARSGMTSSRAAYAAYLRESATLRERRPRCC